MRPQRFVATSRPSPRSPSSSAGHPSALDDKIELNRQTNDTLEGIAQAIFKEWFVDFRFPGATGEMQDSELGPIPKGWWVGPLGKLCYIQNGFAFKSKDFLDIGEIGILKIRNISNGIVDIISTQYISPDIAQTIDNRIRGETRGTTNCDDWS